MKKVLFMAAVIVASLASCKKDRTCTCTTTSTYPGATSTTDIVTYNKAKKHDVRGMCLSTTTTDGGYTTTKDCTLK
jgi:hypothetical protein